MGGFYRISEWIMRLSAINLLWIIGSLPFVYFFVSAVQAMSSGTVENPQAMIIFFIPALVLMPFTLFPSTAAMFTVARKWVMGEEDVPLFKTFFRGFKENYKQSMIGAFFYLLISVVAIVNYRFYTGMHNIAQVLAILFIVLIALLTVSMFHFFSMLVHVHMTTWQLIKNSLLITIGKFFTSLYILITNAVIVYISFSKFTFLIVFFMGSTMAYITFFLFYRMYNKIVETHKALEENEDGDAAEEAEALEDVEQATDSGNGDHEADGQPEGTKELEDKDEQSLETEKKRKEVRALFEQEFDSERFKKY